MTETLDFKRDRWGRPLIPDAEGKLMKPTPYQRPSSLGKVLSDDTQLSKWLQRQVVWGLAKSRPLQMLASSVRDPNSDRDKLSEIVSRALEAAGSSSGADYGTSVHACVEAMLTGGDLAMFPDDTSKAADVALNLVYDKGFTPMLVEQAVVNDEIGCAGTFDLLCHDQDYQVYIFDLKTSKSTAPRYSALSWAVQLSVYAYAENLYDLETQERVEWEAAPSLEKAYVIHVPSDSIEKASLIKLDIEAGYRAALLANTVKNCRKHKFIDPS